MLLSGNLNNWSVADLLQMMRVTSKTAALRIEGTRAGAVHFNEGRIVIASLAGQKPQNPVNENTGEDPMRATVDALFVLTGPMEGSFLVGSPEADPTLHGWEVAELMAEVDRLRMIEDDVFRQGVAERTPLGLTSDVPTPVTLHAEEWGALVGLVPSFSLNSLEQMLGRTRSLQIISTLLARGLTVKGPEPIHVEVELEPPPPSPAPELEPELPVLDWLGDQRVEGAVDLSSNLASEEAQEGTRDQESDTTRRSLKSVVAAAETTLVSGVLGDMRKLRTGSS